MFNGASLRLILRCWLLAALGVRSVGRKLLPPGVLLAVLRCGLGRTRIAVGTSSAHRLTGSDALGILAIVGHGVDFSSKSCRVQAGYRVLPSLRSMQRNPTRGFAGISKTALPHDMALYQVPEGYRLACWRAYADQPGCCIRISLCLPHSRCYCRPLAS